MATGGRWTGILAAVCVGALASTTAQTVPPPVIDMHMHAQRADDQGPPPLGFCPGDVFPPPEQLMSLSIALNRPGF